jgi:hypothetical protein
MSKMEERLEQLQTQYKDVADQAAQAMTLKTKLEGAIEITQLMISEEAAASVEKKEKVKK